jgi:hypothetical protein
VNAKSAQCLAVNKMNRFRNSKKRVEHSMTSESSIPEKVPYAPSWKDMGNIDFLLREKFVELSLSLSELFFCDFCCCNGVTNELLFISVGDDEEGVSGLREVNPRNNAPCMMLLRAVSSL